MTMPKRGRCSICLLNVRLRADGTVGKHEDIDVSGGRYSGVMWAECHGTGRPPRLRDVPAVADDGSKIG